jgi:uncharacterized protein (UPF0332 family)
MSEDLTIAEWRRAQECIGAAWLCQGGGFYPDAISRAYYAILHGAKAALQLYDIDARTHEGVKNAFGRSIAVAGLVERHWSREINSLGVLRRTADYDVTRTFSESDSRLACERSEAFLNRIRALLATTIAPENLGWLQPFHGEGG